MAKLTRSEAGPIRGVLALLPPEKRPRRGTKRRAYMVRLTEEWADRLDALVEARGASAQEIGERCLQHGIEEAEAELREQESKKGRK